MIDELIINVLADDFCEYCGFGYIKTQNEFMEEEFGQCQICNNADWGQNLPWHERYDEIF